ncbi:MAG: alpha-L-fucosidase [Clostridia bacterium]|nr:alpha-L-fucosidase [Clostridia bacterium]
MIVKEYIRSFEKLGLGMFVHFGIYSLIGKGEWVKHQYRISHEDYYPIHKDFCPSPDWAEHLVSIAKNAGCHYITLTARHHDGFSLYDTCGLNDLDAPHACGRDLVREFVDACNRHGIIPFFYHTLLDWLVPSYREDFPTYLAYLRKSVEILCKNYGKIGGIWFDGMWDKPNADWEEDAMYSMIRSYQPEAMIINNTGLDARGALGHIELDSVTFERGKPQPLNLADSPKYIASEMCQVFCDHWGYAELDLNYKSTAEIIEDLTACRRYGSNYLINVGPRPNGSLRMIDLGMLEVLGQWVALHDEALHNPRPTVIAVENKPKDFLLQDGNTYYLFIHKLSAGGDGHVALPAEERGLERFVLPKKVISAHFLDNGQPATFTQEGDTVTLRTESYGYGVNLVVRVVKIVCE